MDKPKLKTNNKKPKTEPLTPTPKTEEQEVTQDIEVDEDMDFGGLPNESDLRRNLGCGG